ncbi:MAG: NAD(P)/FAD-dependent oxidoreductase [Pseudomonadota bacterium]
MTEFVDVVIIGAGQAGLAISHCLAAEGVDHIILEKGAIANRWRAERWASLRLLTPNWMTRLPGCSYEGDDPNGFMMKDELVGYLGRYARSFDAPVREYTQVTSVSAAANGFFVSTSGVTLRARAVVIATGACDRPKLPSWAADLPAQIAQVTTETYNHPGDIATGGVLVIGGSATGVQIAEELHHAGREVTLATGSHVPLPRTYRGRDIMEWMDAAGILSERRDPAISPTGATPQSSLQLVGSAPPRNVGFGDLQSLGVQIAGRAMGATSDEIALSGTLATEMARGSRRRDRLLSRIDRFIDAAGLNAPHTVARTPRARASVAPRRLNLRAAGIRTVFWATGFGRDYTWLRLNALTAQGELKQAGGVCEAAGLFAMGLPFMRRRNSTFIDGVGADASDVTRQICAHLGHARRVAA